MLDLPVTLTNVVLFFARLVVITRLDGTVLRIAEADQAITVSPNNYTPLPGAEISAVKHVLGGEPGSMEIRFAHAVAGVLDTEDLNNGVWDGATVQLYIVDRANISTLGNPRFTGTIEVVNLDPVGGGGSFDIRGIGARAESMIQTYQPMCRTSVFSRLCGLDPDDFDHAGTVGSIIDHYTITVSGLGSPPADGWFNGGTAVAESGFEFEIATWTLSDLTLKTYLPVCRRRLIAGEDLTLYPGCDLRGETCRVKFNNKINPVSGGFQGEDHFRGVNSIVGV